MARFDVSTYVDVQTRIVQFWADHPDGAIVTNLMSPPDDFSQCRYRAEVYRHREDQRPSAVGWAFELATSDPRGGANFSSHEENCECVPLTVRALTRGGWAFYHQLREGDVILGYDQRSESLEWTTITAIRTFDDQPLVQIGNSRFSAICTGNHRWMTSRGLLPWNEIPSRESATITLAAAVGDRGGDPPQAARLAWIVTDGTLQHTNGLPTRATITQSKEENFAELNDLFGESAPVSNAPVREWGGERTASLQRPAMRWVISAARLREVLGRFRVATEADLTRAVLAMTRDELAAFLAAAMRADGSGRVFAKTHLPVVAAVQLAMFLTGHCTGPITERSGNEMTTKPCYTVSQHNKGEKYLSEFTERRLPPQPVWCPTTTLDTWVADFGGWLAITGNTSAIGRALANLGMAKNRDDRPSQQEMAKVNRMHDAADTAGMRDVRANARARAAGQEPVTDDQLTRIRGVWSERGVRPDQWRADLQKLFNVAVPEDLTTATAEVYLTRLAKAAGIGKETTT